jgi:putative tryptophan/tyrosine transport system substrate-binding protein
LLRLAARHSRGRSQRAQQPIKIPRVGILWHAANEDEQPYFGLSRQRLNELGYVESKNIALDDRFAAERYERFDGLAAELVQLKVDVLVAVTQPAALAAQRATTTIPIVFILVPDPVASSWSGAWRIPEEISLA